MTAQPWPHDAREAAYAAAYRVAESKGDGATGPVDEVADAVLAALALHVTPTAPLRELADGWDSFVEVLNPGYDELLRRCADKLRGIIGAPTEPLLDVDERDDG